MSTKSVYKYVVTKVNNPTLSDANSDGYKDSITFANIEVDEICINYSIETGVEVSRTVNKKVLDYGDVPRTLDLTKHYNEAMSNAMSQQQAVTNNYNAVNNYNQEINIDTKGVEAAIKGLQIEADKTNNALGSMSIKLEGVVNKLESLVNKNSSPTVQNSFSPNISLNNEPVANAITVLGEHFEFRDSQMLTAYENINDNLSGIRNKPNPTIDVTMPSAITVKTDPEELIKKDAAHEILYGQNGYYTKPDKFGNSKVDRDIKSHIDLHGTDEKEQYEDSIGRTVSIKEGYYANQLMQHKKTIEEHVQRQGKNIGDVIAGETEGSGIGIAPIEMTDDDMHKMPSDYVDEIGETKVILDTFELYHGKIRAYYDKVLSVDNNGETIK